MNCCRLLENSCHRAAVSCFQCVMTMVKGMIIEITITVNIHLVTKE